MKKLSNIALGMTLSSLGISLLAIFLCLLDFECSWVNALGAAFFLLGIVAIGELLDVWTIAKKMEHHSFIGQLYSNCFYFSCLHWRDGCWIIVKSAFSA